ncbi:MAG: DUF2851 family protein, partial [Thermomicrobiales bacterium]|nr:DUF2851 family protein [Thermomicrobiales bacterium]
MARANRVPEIALSAAWHAGHLPDQFTTVDGESVRVIHRGTWTHGLGPDFVDALLLFNERELRSGAVEMHLETRGWIEHGHHLDPAYDTVVLHVVARHDGTVARRTDGAIVPVTECGLPDASLLPTALLDWDRVGGVVCASELTRSNPSLLRSILHGLGDARLAARSAQIEARLLDLPPAEILWQSVLAGLGYSRNQQPMRLVGERLSVASLEAVRPTQAPERLFSLTLGLLLGVAGFLPLSPAEAHLIGLSLTDLEALKAAWRDLGAPWHGDRLAVSAWDRTRSRPANHPLPRLHAAAAVVENAAAAGGVNVALIALLHTADPVTELRRLTAFRSVDGIGMDRAVEILASAIIPATLAIASHTADHDLAEAASRTWENLPSPAATSVTSRALKQVCGSSSLRRIGARGAQGLIQLDTALCQPRRCFECPVAAAELAVND